MNNIFTGSIAALVTPFKDGEVDASALRALIDWQIAEGTNGVVPCGTTGESSTLTHDEHDRVIEWTVDQVNRRIKVLAGTGSNSTDEAIRLTLQAKKIGADGALLVCPYYNRPTQEGLFQHFQAIAKGVPDFPLVLYNIPGRTGVNLLPETVARLSEIDTIVGIKEATGNLVQASEILDLSREGFAVLSGEDALNWPLYSIGARGAISVTANLFPRLCADLWKAAERGEMKVALKLHQQLLKINQALFIETNPVPIKTALSMIGKCSDQVRLPLVPMKPENRQRLIQILRGYGL